MLFLPIPVLIPAAAPHAIARAVQAPDAPREITFTCTPQSPVRSVNLAGQFNGWSATATPLQRSGASWTVTLPLAPGVYQYKFVLNGGDWTVDPHAPSMGDGNGNRNSVLTVVPVDYAASPGATGDGIITRSGVRHEISAAYVKRLDLMRFSLVLRARKDDVQSCAVLQPGKRELPMERYASDPLYDYWHGVVPAPLKGSLHYAFVLRDGAKHVLYDAGGVEDGASTSHWIVLDPARFPALITPGWARDAVFYQMIAALCHGDSLRWNMPLLAFYRQVIRLRNSSQALRHGNYHTVLADNSTGAFAYSRALGQEHILVVFNRSYSPQTISLPAAACTGLRPGGLLGGAPLRHNAAGYSVTLAPGEAGPLQGAVVRDP